MEPGTWQRFEPTVECGESTTAKPTDPKIFAVQLEKKRRALRGGRPVRLPVSVAASGVVPVGHMT